MKVLLDNGAKVETVTISGVIACLGPRAELSAVVDWISALGSVRFAVDGSPDGLRWWELGSIEATAAERRKLETSCGKYAYLRGRAVLRGSRARALVEADLAFLPG